MGRPLSASHKAAISAGLKRYHASRRASAAPKKPSAAPGVMNISTGKLISQEEAALIMFGTRKATATKKKRRAR